MFAITIEEDSARTPSWTEVPAPEPRPDEVVVSVHATACNRADLLQRRGLYPPPPGASEILGLEAAGIVERVGEEVDSELVGKRVAALLAGGGYAEKVAVPASHLLMMPDGMSFEEAAAIPEVFYTAYLNLFIEAQLQPGETAVIHAAASGVGTAALQLCRLFGCPTIATASGAKLVGLRQFGAEVLVDRHTQDFADVVAEHTPSGADVILDPVGASYLERDLRCLAIGGRLVLIGLLGGSRAELDLARVLRRRLRIIGSVLRARSNAEKAEITRQFTAEVWPRFESGELRPVIDHVLPIQRVDEAHEALRANETVGKIVLAVA